MTMKQILHRLGSGIKRFNQLVLVFPVWLVLGVAGLFRRTRHGPGWQESERNENYGKMY